MENIAIQAEKYVFDIAKESPLRWFFDLHLKEVVASANKLLSFYPNADKDLVIISCWLHDLGHLKAKTLDEVNKVKPDHHIVGAEMAEDFLKQFNLPPETITKIKYCILCHRGAEPHTPNTIEERIVCASDTLSHYNSIFYLSYFKIYPNDSLIQMVNSTKAKMTRDWRDLALLPEAQAIAKDRFNELMSMLNDYQA